jgi:hypothetical protein
VAGSCEHGNEPPGSKKGGELLDWRSDNQLHAVDALSFLNSENPTSYVEARLMMCHAIIRCWAQTPGLYPDPKDGAAFYCQGVHKKK